MHGPGLFLMILRKGLGLFFERANHKSASCPPSTDILEKLGFPSSVGFFASRSDPENIPKEQAQKKRPNKESLETYKEVGMT